MESQSRQEQHDPLILGLTRAEMAERFRAGTQRAVAEHLAAGQPVYGSYGTSGVYAILPESPTSAPALAPGAVVPESRAS